MNLWEETKERLEKYNKKWSDIKYVILDGSEEIIPKSLYEEIAKRTDYDSGYGDAEIYEDLMLIGDDFWFERAEYDGAEWFAYRQMPNINHYTMYLDCNSLKRGEW